ncbi:MAG TPA: hypothetical protein PLU53_09360 [Bacteroidia bacterium]|nr:hypothetical protein [Bacteroidia bacterium]
MGLNFDQEINDFIFPVLRKITNIPDHETRKIETKRWWPVIERLFQIKTDTSPEMYTYLEEIKKHLN